MPVVSTLFGDQVKPAKRICRKTASALAPPDSASLLPSTNGAAQANSQKSTTNNNSSKRYYQELASITPTYTSFYNQPMETYTNKKRFIPKPKPIRVDNRSVKRLQKAMHYLIMTSPVQYTYCKELKRNVRFKLNFITLTIANSNDYDDSFIKANLLDRFLKWIVYKGATGYVWKAEAQKRGTIHFHVTANKYIHWKDIRAYWNALQQRYGCLDAYFVKYGHYNANSTDVHAIKNEERALKYMSKYMMKAEPDKREIEGHKFGYSRNLADIRINMPTNTPEFSEIYNYLNTRDTYTVKFDYVTVMSHPIIDLSVCPPCLADLIHEAVKPKIRVRNPKSSPS